MKEMIKEVIGKSKQLIITSILFLLTWNHKKLEVAKKNNTILYGYSYLIKNNIIMLKRRGKDDEKIIKHDMCNMHDIHIATNNNICRRGS